MSIVLLSLKYYGFQELEFNISCVHLVCLSSVMYVKGSYYNHTKSFRNTTELNIFINKTIVFDNIYVFVYSSSLKTFENIFFTFFYL